MSSIKKAPLMFGILFMLLIVSPVALYKYYETLLTPVGKYETTKTTVFVVSPGQPLTQIAQNLKDEGLIKSAFAFRLLVAQMAISRSIQAGDFHLSSDMSSREIASNLTHGAIDIWVTIPEGLRAEEQADRIEEKLKFGSNEKYQFDKREYIKIAKEGYMYPDTYLIPKDATAQDIVKRFQDTFDQKVSKSLLEKGATNNLSTHEVVVLASLIEKEAKISQEKPIIAGILLNRINTGFPLQVDATVAYAKGYVSSQNTWWPQVTVDEYRSVKSPFNTYLNVGLPPLPISNPGLDSITAASNPQPTDYFFYLHDAEGKIHYAKTAQEHQQNIRDFL